MRWFKRDTWKAAIIIAGILLFLFLFIGIPLSIVSAQGSVGEAATPTPATVKTTPTMDVTATMTALNEQKLAVDIRKENNDIFWGWTTMGTIVVGVVGVLATFLQALRNRQDTQRKELRDRAEERFKAAVTALGDKNEATQVGGAILLRSFLNKDDEEIYGRYYTQIFDLAVAYLRRSNEAQSSGENIPLPLTSLRQALVTVLQESYSLARDASMNQKKTRSNPRFLNASNIYLPKFGPN